MMNKARDKYKKKGTPRLWCGPFAWDELLKIWDTPQYKEIQNQAKKNRASEKGGVLHTTGRVPHFEITIQAVCITLFILCITLDVIN